MKPKKLLDSGAYIPCEQRKGGLGYGRETVGKGLENMWGELMEDEGDFTKGG